MEQQNLIVDGKVQPQNGTALQVSTPTPMALLQIAMSQNADIDKLQKLLEMQERWEANEARKAYNAAIAKFKANPPEISKNKHVKFGTTEYSHATLDHVTETITKSLSDVGMGFRWDVQQNGPEIAVTCILTHELGHSERTTLKASADTSGSKNSIQAIGSAVTYLQRYTLLAACGMAAKGADDDAQTGAKMEDVKEAVEFVNNSRDRAELKKVFTAQYEKASKIGDKQAMASLIQAKNAKYKELAA